VINEISDKWYNELVAIPYITLPHLDPVIIEPLASKPMMIDLRSIS